MAKPEKRPAKMTNEAFPVRKIVYETDSGAALAAALARRRGVSLTALYRLLVREEAARSGLERSDSP